jgi:glyoxylase-like metal-dependent hydrolase (beta-lactamase superfamily II)
MKALLAGLLSFSLVSCASGPRMESGTLDRAISAVGGADALGKVKTIAVRGTVKQWEPEQSEAPGGDMRFAVESSFSSVGDFSTRSVRTDWEKKYAYPAPRTYKFSEIVTPQAGYVMGVDTTARNAQSMKMDPPAHTMSSLRLAATQRELRRASPLLLLDMKSNPDRVRSAPDVSANGVSYPSLAYEAGNMRYIVAFDRATGLPARIRTLDYDNIWGDVNYDLVLSNWREVSGIKIPMTQKYELNGRVISDMALTDVQVNAPVAAESFAIPPAMLATAAKPATSEVNWQWVIRRPIIGVYLDSEAITHDASSSPGLRLQELAPGVQHVVGGTHNSLVVEMSDHLIVFDAPVSDAQSKWVIDAAKSKYPGKPIRTLVLTHHHMDHAGGLRAYVAQGANLVVGQGAADHYRKVLAAPFTRNPDLASQDLSRVQITEVADRYVMSDGKRQVSAHAIENGHAKGMLIGYVPEARLGFVADLWSPGRDALPGKITPPLMAIVQTVRKAGIAPVRFAGGHGSNGEYQSLASLAGESSSVGK